MLTKSWIFSSSYCTFPYSCHIKLCSLGSFALCLRVLRNMSSFAPLCQKWCHQQFAFQPLIQRMFSSTECGTSTQGMLMCALSGQPRDSSLEGLVQGEACPAMEF